MSVRRVVVVVDAAVSIDVVHVAAVRRTIKLNPL